MKPHHNLRAFALLAIAALSPASPAAQPPLTTPSALQPFSLSALSSPILLRGDARTAYRDPLLIHHDGTFYLYYSYVLEQEDHLIYWYVALSTSPDLRAWSAPRILTPKDQNLNYSSPGNIVRVGDEWIMTLQTYPIANFRRGDKLRFCDARARVHLMRSKDLLTWSPPELLRVKGPDIPESAMGKMIDPYLLRDKDAAASGGSSQFTVYSSQLPNQQTNGAVAPTVNREPRTVNSDGGSAAVWWCLYKQDGHMRASLSTDDLKTWTPVPDADLAEGENACVLVQNNEYVFFYAPANGIGVKRGPDLFHLRPDGPPLTFDQPNWPWAATRLTAGYVEDLRSVPGVNKYVMVFHGMGPGKTKTDANTNANCSIAIAWSDDLKTWHWPAQPK